MIKGKENIFSGYAFNDEGLVSQEAIKLLDSGALNFFTKKFGKCSIDMNEKVSKDLTVNVLNNAINGTLHEIMS